MSFEFVNPPPHVKETCQTCSRWLDNFGFFPSVRIDDSLLSRWGKEVHAPDAEFVGMPCDGMRLGK